MVADEETVRKVCLEQTLAHGFAEPLGLCERNEAVRVEGVGRLGARKRPLHVETSRLILPLAVHRSRTLDRYVVLLGDQLLEWLVQGGGDRGVEFESAVANAHRVTVLELLDRFGQLARAEVAKRADHVAPDV